MRIRKTSEMICTFSTARDVCVWRECGEKFVSTDGSNMPLTLAWTRAVGAAAARGNCLAETLLVANRITAKDASSDGK